MSNQNYMQMMCSYYPDKSCGEWKGLLKKCKHCSWNQPVEYKVTTSTWQTCPICGGNGLVAGGFYNQVGGFGTSTNVTEMCRTCNGRGIISSLNGLPPQ